MTRCLYKGKYNEEFPSLPFLLANTIGSFNMHFVDTLEINFVCPSQCTYKINFQSIYKVRIKCTYCGGKPKIAS